MGFIILILPLLSPIYRYTTNLRTCSKKNCKTLPKHLPLPQNITPPFVLPRKEFNDCPVLETSPLIVQCPVYSTAPFHRLEEQSLIQVATGYVEVVLLVILWRQMLTYNFNFFSVQSWMRLLERIRDAGVATGVDAEIQMRQLLMQVLEQRSGCRHVTTGADAGIRGCS